MASLLVNLTSALPHSTAAQETKQDKKSVIQCRKDTIDFLSKLDEAQNENSKTKDKVLDEYKSEIGADRFLDIAPTLSRMKILDPIKVSASEYIIRRRENLYNLHGAEIKTIIKRVRKGFYDPSFGRLPL
jgi:hypothetical protein